jgi:hypothetical protein
VGGHLCAGGGAMTDVEPQGEPRPDPLIRDENGVVIL